MFSRHCVGSVGIGWRLSPWWMPRGFALKLALARIGEHTGGASRQSFGQGSLGHPSTWVATRLGACGRGTTFRFRRWVRVLDAAVAVSEGSARTRRRSTYTPTTTGRERIVSPRPTPVGSADSSADSGEVRPVAGSQQTSEVRAVRRRRRCPGHPGAAERTGPPHSRRMWGTRTAQRGQRPAVRWHIRRPWRGPGPSR